jgi:ribulose-5-phosphate 4-epimerase/fuculose-1-phosphate aldolase
VTTDGRVFFCPDKSHVPGDEFIAVVRAGLQSQGHEVVLQSPEFGEAFIRDDRRGEGLLCFVPAGLHSLERLASDARRLHRRDGQYAYMGVVGLGGPTVSQGGPEWRRAFGALIAAGFHVSHPELIDGELVWDPARVGDFCFDPDENSIRFGSRQVGEAVPDDVAEGCYLSFRSAIAQIFGARLLDGLTDGALALRLPDGRIVVNATKTAKAPTQFCMEDLVVLEDWSGATNTLSWSGRRPPSSGAVWYWSILKARPDVEALVHTHCRGITYSAAPEVLPLRCPTFAPYGGTSGLADLLRILSYSPVAILRAHGQVAVGRTFDEALDHIVGLRQRVVGAYVGPP